MSPPVSLDSRGAGLDDEDEYDEMCRWPVLSDDFVRGPPPAGARESALIAETLAVMAHLGVFGIARSVSREVNSDGAHSAQRPSSLRASAAAPAGLSQSGHRAE